eukprot:1234000-Amphidinium_carterae.1
MSKNITQKNTRISIPVPISDQHHGTVVVDVKVFTLRSFGCFACAQRGDGAAAVEAGHVATALAWASRTSWIWEATHPSASTPLKCKLLEPES